MTEPDRKKLVLVGSGHSHIQVLKAFGEIPPPDCHLTVVVDTPIALYSGMVPGFVAGQYRIEELQIDARPLAERASAEVIVAKALSIDPEKKQIELEGHPPVPYDRASFNIGSTVTGLDLPGIREYALPTRPIAGLVAQVDELIRRAQQHTTGTPFRIVVVGGGAGGVELAFTLQSRLKKETRTKIDMTLVTNGPEILTAHSRSMIKRVYRHAKRRQITIVCQREVVAAKADGVVFRDGETLASDALIWVAGPVSHPLFTESRLPVDHRGFVRVRPTLQFENYDDLFAVGDCATLIDYPDTPKAGVYAVREGPIITANLRAALQGKPLTKYKPQSDFLMLINLGGGTAIGSKWGFSFEGRWVMKWKDRIDRAFMSLFQIPPVA